MGMNGRRRIERTGKLLRSLAPDVAALQEVDLRHRHGMQRDGLNYLRSQVGEHSHEAWALTGVDGNYGQLLVSRYPITRKIIHDVSLPGREPRKVMEAFIELTGARIRVIATHLGLWPGEKSYQLSKLREIINSERSLPLLLMGDLNEFPGGRVRNLLSELFDEHTSHRSFPSHYPIMVLDRIACRGGLRILESRVAGEDRWASDHLPLVAAIQLDQN